MTPEHLAVIAAAFALGGVLKGATGFGAPVIAIPLMALYFDMGFAVTVFAIPNLVPNLWQSWRYRHDRLPVRNWLPICAGAVAGMIPGTFLLVSADQKLLSAMLGGLILTYVCFRLLRPTWRLGLGAARWLGFPVGFGGGVLQGSTGLSAPLSLTFLNALGLGRRTFICTISMYFVSLGLLQIPLLIWWGEMTWPRLGLGFAALLPLLAAMPVGTWVAKFLSERAFDRLILVIMAGLGLKLLSVLL